MLSLLLVNIPFFSQTTVRMRTKLAAKSRARLDFDLCFDANKANCHKIIK